MVDTNSSWLQGPLASPLLLSHPGHLGSFNSVYFMQDPTVSCVSSASWLPPYYTRVTGLTSRSGFTPIFPRPSQPSFTFLFSHVQGLSSALSLLPSLLPALSPHLPAPDSSSANLLSPPPCQTQKHQKIILRRKRADQGEAALASLTP